MKPQVLVHVFRRVRWSLEQLHPCGKMAHRLLVSRALPSGLPVRDGLRTQAGLGVVVRQQLGLGLDGVREP